MQDNHVLMLHGALGSAREYIGLLTSTAGGLSIMDFHGHGLLPKEPFTIQTLSEQVIEVIEREAIENLAVVGYSMGGYVALNVARTHPKAFRKIVTLGTKFNWSMDSVQKQTALLNPKKLKEEQPKFVEYLTDLHDETWPELVNYTVEMMEGLGRQPLLTQTELAEIKTPTFIHRGSKDYMVTTDESFWAAKHLPNGSFTELEGVRHQLSRVPEKTIIELYELAANPD